MSLVPLEIRQRERDGVVILELKGRLTLGPEDSSLRRKLQTLLDSGAKNLLLDLRDITFIDSAAVGALVLWAERFQNANGHLALLKGVAGHATPDDVLKLDIAVPTYTDEQLAINSFYPDRAVPRYDLLAFLDAVRRDEPTPEPEPTRERE